MHHPSVISFQPGHPNLPARLSDCRTVSNEYTIAVRKQSLSPTTTSTTPGSPGAPQEVAPASIFEHRRPSPLATTKDGGRQSSTNVRYPTSFDDIKLWLDGHVADARAAAAALPQDANDVDMSSSINVLFLDEKKCAKSFKQGFALNCLLPKLKIKGWCTSHYQTTYCRYPLPLDRDCDDEPMQSLWNWRYSLSHPYDWDLVWAYFPHTRTTVAIVRTWFDGHDISFTQLGDEIKDFEGPTLAHPMLFGLLALQILTSDAMGNVREKGNMIYEAETLTGFHQYDKLRATDGDGCTVRFDLGSVSRKVIGAADQITGWENATVEMARFAGFAQAENQRYMASKSIADGGGGLGRAMERLQVYIDERAEKLLGDIRGAHHDSRAWLATAKFLLMGVLNVLGHEDSQVNIELAKDQKRIAQETKRDSTSMTAIAIVTMFFLPGTFTAVSVDLPNCARGENHADHLAQQTFFALPYFASDTETTGFQRFWVYWVVTIPLTIFTLAMWTLYTRFLNPAHLSASDANADMGLDDLNRRVSTSLPDHPPWMRYASLTML